MLTKDKIQEYKDLDSQVDWYYISAYQKLSEDFIREFKDKVNWSNISVNQTISEDFIREFKDQVLWSGISRCQIISEDFISEFQDQVNWITISFNQKLSEDFIREFKDKVDWDSISVYQTLSESFIREFKDQVTWYSISCSQKLSEDFIREFKNKVNWNDISTYQILSESFIEEFKDKVNIKKQKRSHHDNRTVEQKRKEMKSYAQKHNLKFENDILHAFREHDPFGRGVYNRTISYKPGEYHRDWHCDLNPKNENSFGLGIWPKGNTPVEVKLEDWGVAVKRDDKGKARVFRFRIA